MPVYIIVGCFIAFDIITGLIKALFKGGINSSLLRVGLFRKLAEILAVVASNLLEYGTNFIDLGFDFPVLKAVALYIVFMEITSIIENLGEINPTLGKIFKPYLEKLKKIYDKDVSNMDETTDKKD